MAALRREERERRMASRDTEMDRILPFAMIATSRQTMRELLLEKGRRRGRRGIQGGQQPQRLQACTRLSARNPTSFRCGVRRYLFRCLYERRLGSESVDASPKNRPLRFIGILRFTNPTLDGGVMLASPRRLMQPSIMA